MAETKVALASAHAPRTSVKFDSKREAVLNAAARIFNRDGVRGATLADVASDVGLNIKSLRYYFTRKDDLAAAAFLRAINIYSNVIAQASVHPSADARVGDLVRLYFEMTRDVTLGTAPPFLHFGDIRALPEPQAGPVFAAFNDMFRSLRRLVQTPDLEAAGRRTLNARTHLVLSQLLWSVVWTQRYEPDDLTRAAERMADILLRGLALDLERWRPRISPLPISAPDHSAGAQSAFLRAATALVNDQGYRGTSIDRIAAAINMTKGAFYHYHDSKDEVVVACFERTFQMVRSAQDRSWLAASGLEKVTDAACLLVHHQLTEEGPLLRTSALTAVPAPLRTQMTERLDRITARFADGISDGIIDGSVRACDAVIAAQMITALINSTEELPRWLSHVEPDEAISLYAAPGFLGLYCPTGSIPGYGK